MVLLGGTVRSGLVLLLPIAFSVSSQAAVATSCEVIGRIVSLQGSIDVLRAGEWLRVRRLNTPICEGDQIRAAPLSRAAITLGLDTIVRVDQNTTVSVEQAGDETVVTLLVDAATQSKAPNNACGAVYCVTRHKRAFRVRTPFYSAVHEGTEFLASTQCDRGELYVFEGKVALQDLAHPTERTRLEAGQAIAIGAGEPRTVRALVKPPDAVQWTFYYPPLTDFAASDEEAFGRNCEALEPIERKECLTVRAEALLRLGQADEARRAMALAADPSNGDAQALNAVIAVVRNEKEQALAAARAATQAAPDAYRPWLALSYAHQATFDLEGALQDAQRAAELAPNSALARARVAELLLSLGRFREAEKEAKRAVGLNPKVSRGHLILGFVRLAQSNTKAAREDLVNAMELDPTEPLARLGLGLAAIRDGDLAAGREHIEIAVALDPTNSLLRSYLGKAYHEENTKERDEFAATQFRLAKELDPNDPTPWFYNAIALQTLNRPGEALQELQESIARNDNRAVYRSRLLLDQDQGARSASLARIYSDLGFNELAVTEARNALNNDPGSFGAHRFLAEAYGQLPRFEIARISETLQSQLLQPVNAAPLAPQLQQIRSPVLFGSGPITPSFQEFNPLFAQDRHALSASTVAGSQNTLADEVIYGYYGGRRSFQLGQYHYETDGFKANADRRDNIYRAFYQEDVTPQTSFQFELNQSEARYGDPGFQFEAGAFSPFARTRIELTGLRIGARHSWASDSALLGSLIAQRRRFEFTDSISDPTRTIQRNLASVIESYSAELQYLRRHHLGDTVAGAGFYHESEAYADTSVSTFSSPFPPFSLSFLTPTFTNTRLSSGNAYLYRYFGYPGSLRFTLGVSVNTIDYELPSAPPSETVVNPKFGLIAPVGETTTVRFAAFRAVKTSLSANATIEPTQVAGFNQIFDDTIQTRFWRFGAAIDQSWSHRVFAGLEFTRRNLEVPSGISYVGDSFTGFTDRTELLHRAYITLLPARRLSATGEFLFERQEETTREIETQSLPVTVTYHDPSGIFSLARFTLVRQQFRLSDHSDSEDFDVLDLSLGARLPRRWGIVSADVKNVFATKFQFQDTALEQAISPSVPLYVPERAFFLRLQLNI